MTTSKTETTTRKFMKAVGRTTLTLFVAGAAGAAIVLGVGLLNARAAAVPDPVAAPAVPVEVSTVVFQDSYTLPRRFIGQIESSATVALSFELGGRLDALLVQEGDLIEAGQELARLDTDLLHAEAARLNAARAAASAQLTFAEARLTRAIELQKQGHVSQERFDQALATRDELVNRIAETDAALQSVSINLQKSVIYAPVSGQVGAQDVDSAETVQAGQRIILLMQTAEPELRVGLPLAIEAHDLSSAEIEIGSMRIAATLKTLRPDMDPVTRTRTALFKLDPGSDVIFGQTAALVMETKVAARGAWVPLDALQSGNGSVWTVMIVVDDTLQRAAVELLHIDGARAFVQGTLEPGDRIVTSGAHRVVAGQAVRVLAAEG